MNEVTIDKILELTSNFYRSVASEFSVSRQYPWKGWETVLKYLPTSPFSLLDIACGNGRFLEYMVNNMKSVHFSYLGIDNNDFLLSKVPKQGRTLKIDVLKDISGINEKYNLVVAFGITHHIPGSKFRIDWFKNAAKLVEKNGLLIFTIWNLKSDTRSKKLLTEVSGLEKKELEEGDYFYNWNNKNIYRYFHTYSKKELNEIDTVLNKSGLKLVDKFDSDGANNRLNTYFVYSKIR